MRCGTVVIALSWWMCCHYSAVLSAAKLQGNPRYQSQVYKALVALLSSASCVAQRMATHTLRLIQPSMGVASAAIVEPVLQLLKNLNVDVQHEGSLSTKERIPLVHVLCRRLG